MDKRCLLRMKKISSGNSKWNRKCMLCLLPSLLGIATFYLIPYVRVLYYSFVNNQFQKKFVWLRNYREVIEKEFFRLALRNSFKIILIGVPILIILALTISLVLSFSLRRFRILRDFFIFPMVVPTAAIVTVWQIIFEESETELPIYLLFIWKNIGICIILLTAALTLIDDCIYDAAMLDGAGGIMLHAKVSIPMITPTVLFTVLLSIMNSFRIFKESYLFYGGKYPPEHSYTLQFFMNNNFLKFDYPTLAAASVITSLLILIIVTVGLRLQQRVQQ